MSLSLSLSSLSSSSPASPGSVDQAIRTILEKNFDADSKICFLTLLKIIDNVLQKPGNEKVRSLRTGNSTIRSKILDKHGHHLLMACGFVHQAADPKWQREEILVLTKEEEDTQLLIRARHTLAKVAVLELGLKSGDIPPYKAPPALVSMQANGGTNVNGNGNGNTSNGNTANAFNVYAGNRFDGQSAAAGTNLGAPKHWKSKTEKELEALKQREAKLQREMAAKHAKTTTKATTTTTKAAASIDRQWAVFLPGQNSPSPSSQPALSKAEAMANSTALKLTPSSSKHNTSSTTTTNNNNSATRGDSSLLASHFQQQHAKRVASDSRGFTTKAMRDLEKLKTAKVYSHTQLAIQFPDGLSVRANFATTERLTTVISDLFNEVLFDTTTMPLPGLSLYQTPPRRVLEPSHSLKKLGLVPAAKVYVSWNTPLLKLGGALHAGWYPPPNPTCWYIRQELLSPPGGGAAQSSSSVSVGPVLPTSVPVLQSKAEAQSAAGGGADANNNNNNNNTARRKKTRAEKEAALMKRMLGKR